jgi:hypothetical protein
MLRSTALLYLLPLFLVVQPAWSDTYVLNGRHIEEVEYMGNWMIEKGESEPGHITMQSVGAGNMVRVALNPTLPLTSPEMIFLASPDARVLVGQDSLILQRVDGPDAAPPNHPLQVTPPGTTCYNFNFIISLTFFDVEDHCWETTVLKGANKWCRDCATSGQEGESCKLKIKYLSGTTVLCDTFEWACLTVNANQTEVERCGTDLKIRRADCMTSEVCG